MDRNPDQPISLNPQQSDWVHKQIEDGRFSSPSEVVKEAIRQMEEAEDFHPAEYGMSPDQFREVLEEAWQEVQRGEARDGEEVMRELDELDKRERDARPRKRA